MYKVRKYKLKKKRKMKTNFKVLLLSAFVGTAMLVSCDKDNSGKDESEWVRDNFVGVEYTDESGLSLSYSSSPMFGKVAQVTGCDEDGITISLQGESYALPTFGTTIATAGVFPGEVVSTVTVPYKKAGDVIEINTSVDSGAYSYDMKATLTKGSFAISIDNVNVAADISMAGMKLNLVNYDGQYTVDPGTPIAEVDAHYPYHLLFEPEDATINVIFPLPVMTVLRLAFAFPMIEFGESQVSLTTALQTVLKSVEFNADGNVVATILDTESGSYVQSPLNLAHYNVLNDHQVALFLSPATIAAVATKADQNDLLAKLIEPLTKLVAYYAPMLSEGIVLEYGVNPQTGIMTVYLGHDFFKPLGQTASALLADPEIMELLNGLIDSEESLADFSAIIKMLIPQLPGLLDSCTNFELGLNFKVAAE